MSRCDIERPLCSPLLLLRNAPHDSRLNAETKQEIFRLEPNPRLLLSIFCFFLSADLPKSGGEFTQMKVHCQKVMAVCVRWHFRGFARFHMASGAVVALNSINFELQSLCSSSASDFSLFQARIAKLEQKVHCNYATVDCRKYPCFERHAARNAVDAFTQ